MCHPGNYAEEAIKVIPSIGDSQTASVSMRKHQVIGVSVAVRGKTSGNSSGRKIVWTVSVGGHQAIRKRGTGQVLVAIVSIDGLLVQSVVVGRDFMIAIIAIAGNLDAQGHWWQ